jgi:hypothetical protein
MSKRRFMILLSLSQRERIEVRDWSPRVFLALTKSPGGRCRVLPGLDDSRIESRQFLVWPEIPLACGHAFREDDSRGLNRQVRWQVSGPDNRNPRCKDRWDAAAEICSVRSFDFEDDAREYVRNRSPFSGGNGRESLGECLAMPISQVKRNRPPLTSILSPQRGRGGLRMHPRGGVFGRQHGDAIHDLVFDGRYPGPRAAPLAEDSRGTRSVDSVVKLIHDQIGNE